FAEYRRTRQTGLYGDIHSVVSDLNDADDLYQQPSLILWKNLDESDRQRSFFSWSCGIARLEIANFLRRRGRRRLYFSDDLSLLLIEAQAEVGGEKVGDRRGALGRCVGRIRQRDGEFLTECYAE